jgi:hypothetical protein
VHHSASSIAHVVAEISRAFPALSLSTVDFRGNRRDRTVVGSSHRCGTLRACIWTTASQAGGLPMDVDPATSAKRAKAKAAPPHKTAKPVITTKKARGKAVPETVVVATPLPTQTVAEADGAVEVLDLTADIAATAYYIAAGRNFAPGHELEDWLEAERRVKTPLK